ncbi:MAG: UDP-N-acetylglucosamine 2-epimerase (non-hydrolyzing) [Bacteroidetes bacterium]|nr:UDP-N-acetylglucosamine 2-epimerase (non-hydrolyzing) [Bacteroidota bacterium]
MKIVTIIGARPQFIKAATVSRQFRGVPDIHEILVHTGQHYDENMSEVFFRELEIPLPDFNLGVGSGTHAYQTGMMMIKIEEVLLREKPDFTLVYGDTNSTIAGSLSSVKLHIPVAHVEAGLRSFNRSMPEEINRIVTDRISDLLFAPTTTAIKNLENEGLAGNACFTGDVMYDSVLYYAASIRSNPEKFNTKGIPGLYLLATIHRAENTDNPENILNILEAFSRIDYPVIFPVHPRTRKVISSIADIPSNVHVINPVGYLEMLKLTMNAHKVITDSGGLQKEAYFLGKQCITIRNETEWVETLHDHWNILTGTLPGKILEAIHSNIPISPRKTEFGNGKAGAVILEKLHGRV